MDTETFTKNYKRKQSKKVSHQDEDRLWEDHGDDFPSMTVDMLKHIPFKEAFLLFLLMVFVFSDLFIEIFLTGIYDALEGDSPTTKGTMIQIIVSVIGFIVIDLLISGGFL